MALSKKELMIAIIEWFRGEKDDVAGDLLGCYCFNCTSWLLFGVQKLQAS